MSDTVSGLASRAQAREEFGNQVQAVMIASEAIAKSRGGFEIHPTDRDAAAWVIDPEVFPRLAGLLGYVKADGVEWGCRDHYGQYYVCADRAVAEHMAEAKGYAIVRRVTYFGPWEVVTDADPR